MDYSNIDMSKITLCKTGKKIVKLMYNNDEPFQLKTSELFMPFTLNKFKNHWSSFSDYSVECYVSDTEFSYKLIELDNTINNLFKTNTVYFPDITNDYIYSKIYRDNKDYPKLLKLNFPRDNNGNFTTCFFDENSKSIIVNDQNIEDILIKKSNFKTLITNSKVWSTTNTNKVGSTWDVVQLKLISPKTNKNSSKQEIYLLDD